MSLSYSNTTNALEHRYGLLNRIMGLSSTDDKSSERTKKRAKVAKLERKSSQELKYHIKYEKVDPSDHKQRKELFDKYVVFKSYTLLTRITVHSRITNLVCITL